MPAFIARRLPFERRCVAIRSGLDAGRHLHLIEHGEAGQRPVLLLHGNPTWSFLWRRVIKRLEGVRAVAPDLLGLGLSDRLPRVSDHSLERHAEAVADLVLGLDLEGLVLVVQDWGGPIGASVAARLEGRISGLVLANTSIVLPERLRAKAFHRFAHKPLISDLAFRLMGFPLRSLHRVQGDPASIRGEVARAYRWPLRRFRDRVAPLALARMVPFDSQHPSLPELRRGDQWLRSFSGPTAVVWGERDPVMGRAAGRHLQVLPQASVCRTQAGHFLQEEVPDELAAAVHEVVGQLA